MPVTSPLNLIDDLVTAVVSTTATTTADTGSTSLTPIFPAGSVSGNVLVAYYVADGTTSPAAGMTAPTGWTLVTSRDVVDDQYSSVTTLKVYRADGAVTSAAWSKPSASAALLTLVRFTGVSSTTAQVRVNTQVNPRTATPTSPSVAPHTTSDALLTGLVSNGVGAGVSFASAAEPFTRLVAAASGNRSTLFLGAAQLYDASAVQSRPFTASTAFPTLGFATVVAGPTLSTAAGIQYINETWTGTDGSPWPSTWTTNNRTGASGTISGNKGRYNINGSAAYTPTPLSTTSVPTTATSFDVTFDVAFDNLNEQYLNTYVRGQGNPSTLAGFGGYSFNIYPHNGTSTMGVSVLNTDGNETAISGDLVAGNWTAGTARRVRYYMQGSAMKVKVWAVGAAEPAAWLWEGNDTSFLFNAGTMFISLTSSDGTQRAATFDNMTVNDTNYVAGATYTSTLALSGEGTLATVGPASPRVSMIGGGQLSLTAKPRTRYATAETATESATGRAGSRRLDTTSNGVTWMAYQSNAASINMAYTLNGGDSWTDDAAPYVNSYSGGTVTCAMYIDVDDFAHLAFTASQEVGGSYGGLYYMRGTPNAARTGWTWSPFTLLYAAGQDSYGAVYPDIVAHRDPANVGSYLVHVVVQNSTSSNNQGYYTRLSVTGAGAVTQASQFPILSNPKTNDQNSGIYPSIDFRHTGDGKTAAASPDVLIAASVYDSTGTGNSFSGIWTRVGLYSAGSYSFNSDIRQNATGVGPIVYTDGAGYINVFCDGSRWVVAGQTTSHLFLFERDFADTTTTTRFAITGTNNNFGSDTTAGVAYGSVTYDTAGNAYFFGSTQGRGQGVDSIAWRKWTRATNTLAPRIGVDGTGYYPFAVTQRNPQQGLRPIAVYTDRPTSTTYAPVFTRFPSDAIAGTESSDALVFGSMPKIARTTNDVVWAAWTDVAKVLIAYSTNNGQSWSTPTLVYTATGGSPAKVSMVIAQDDTMHLVVRDIGTNGPLSPIYVFMTPDAARTTYTSRYNVALMTSSSGWDNCDLVAYATSASGWTAHFAIASSGYLYYQRAYITYDSGSGGYNFSLAYATGNSQSIYNDSSGNVSAIYPSIDFQHTGDGKTPSATPNIYIVAGTNFANGGTLGGVRVGVMTYNSPTSWSLNGAGTFDASHRWSVNTNWLRGFWDGTRFVVAGNLSDPDGATDVILHDYNGNTQRTLVDNVASTALDARVYGSGSATYDADGNVYFLGTDLDQALGNRNLGFGKWTRSTGVLGPRNVVDSSTALPYASVPRQRVVGSIDYLYTDGTDAYQIKGGNYMLPLSLSGSGSLTFSAVVTQSFAITGTGSAATYHSNGRHLDKTSNGVLWQLYNPLNNNLSAAYSTDNGQSWTGAGTVAVYASSNSEPLTGSMHIDLDDYAHVVFSASAWSGLSYGGVLYTRGTPNANKTSYTWSTPTTVFAMGSDRSSNAAYAPDVVSHRDPANAGAWVVHTVFSYTTTSTNYAYYYRLTINSSGSPTVAANQGLATSPRPNTLGTPTWPSIDFRHTGDGKTIQTQPDVYTSWNGVDQNNSVNSALRFRKATYSAGSWTWGTDTALSANFAYGNDVGSWSSGFYDGTRYVAIGMTYRDVFIVDRDAADTTTTARSVQSSTPGYPNDSAQGVGWGSAGYDSAGNIYLVGATGGQAAGSRLFGWHKWNRSTQVLGDRISLDTTVGTPYASVRRAITPTPNLVYTDINDSGYGIRYTTLTQLGDTLNLSGSGTLAVSGVATYSGSTALSGSGTLSSSATPSPKQTLALSGSGTLTSTGKPSTTAAQAASGSGTLQTYGLPSTETFAGTSFSDPRWAVFNVNGTFTFGGGVGTFNQSNADYQNTSFIVFNIERQDYFLRFDVDMRTALDSFLALYLRQPSGTATTGAYEHRMFLSNTNAPGSGTMDVFDGNQNYVGYQTNAPGGAGPQYTIEVEVKGTRVRFWASPVGGSRQILYYDSDATGNPYSNATANYFSLTGVSATGDNTTIPIDNFVVYSESPTQVNSGSVALSGSGTQTLSGSPSPTGSISTSGSGTLTGSGSPTAKQTLATSGSGTQSSSGTPSLTASRALSGDGSLTFTSSTTSSGSTSLSGSGSLATVATNPSFTATRAFSGSGTLTATASNLSQSGSESGSGAGTLTNTGTPNLTGSRIYTGTGTLDLSGAGAQSGSVATSGSGSQTASGTPNITGALSTTGSGTLTNSALVSLSGSTSTSGSGSLSASGAATATQTLALSGSGTLSPAGRASTAGSVDLSGDSALTSTARITTSGSVNYSGDSLLLVGSKTFAGSLLLAGTGNLTRAGSPTLNTSGTATAAASATFTASTQRTTSATTTVALTATSTASKTAIRDVPRPFAVTASSTQTRDLVTEYTAFVNVDAQGLSRTLRVSSTDYAYVRLTASAYSTRSNEQHVSFGTAYVGVRANAAVSKIGYTNAVARVNARTSYTGVHRAVFSQRAFMGFRASFNATTQRARYETAPVGVSLSGTSTGTRVSAGVLRLATSADAFWYFTHHSTATATVSVLASATHAPAPVYREIDLTFGDARTGYTVGGPRTDVGHRFGGVSNERRGRVRQR